MKADHAPSKERRLSLLTAIRNNGMISTSKLANATQGDPKKVYRDCHEMEKDGLLSSSSEPGQKLLFCVDDREVITHDNHEEHEGHDLRSFFAKVKVWTLTDRGREFILRTRSH